ncbi:hypothetical protein FOL47_007986 [Perkinsus chesapeaki]|uniref:Uncharacterized protein n=1 Tax=Perkinsus chesapeaki TaxID=330153 RepID=A0A7J6LGJ3_PERCH|nr:hypothetical protein FOL47_007986 [Perkinsus chesapeaki]
MLSFASDNIYDSTMHLWGYVSRTSCDKSTGLGYAAARLRVSPNHPCLLAIVPQIRLLLLSRVPTTIKDDFNCLDACYTLGYDNLSRVLAIHAQRNLAAVEDLDDLIAVGRKIKENGAENAQTWIPWWVYGIQCSCMREYVRYGRDPLCADIFRCEAVDERLQALQNDEFYTKALSQRNIADIERTFTTLRRSLRHVNAFKVKHGRQAVTDGLTNPALSVEGF